MALRHLNAGRVSYVWPMTVVEHCDERTGLFIARGTPTLRRVALNGQPIDRSVGYAAQSRIPWRLGRARWWGCSALQLHRSGEPYAFWALFEPSTSSLQRWYVNLQDPLRRTSIGFDTIDHILDIVVEGDLSSWSWKDADELEDAIRVGGFTQAQAAVIRHRGEQAIALMQARAWPFDRSWNEWRPDPHWQLPDVREEWAVWGNASQHVARNG